MAEQCLRPPLPLVGGQIEPAQRLARILRHAIAVQKQPGQGILRVRIPEIRGGVGIHLARPLRVGLHLGIGDAVEIVMAELDEGVGDKAGLRQMRRILGTRVRDPAEKLKRTQIVTRNAIADGIHPAKLPLRERVSMIGGVLQRRQRLVVLAGLQRRGTGPEGLDRSHRRSGVGRRGGSVEREGWREPERAGHRAEPCETIHPHS